MSFFSLFFFHARTKNKKQSKNRQTPQTMNHMCDDHVSGGAVWKITKDSEEIVYAVDYNHAQER
jgi:hypothetical protein